MAQMHDNPLLKWMSIASLLLAVCFIGCRKAETRFDILSFKDQPNSQVFTESFESGYFYVGADKNWTLAFEITPTYVDPYELSDDDSEENKDPEHPSVPLRMSQTLLVEVFWRAQPGRTFSESSQTNANILYCLTAGRESISYEGAGFVSFKLSRDGKSLTGRIESSSLTPVRVVGAPIDLFGTCRLTGTFEARKDRSRTVALQQALRKRLGQPAPPASDFTSAN